MAIFQPAFVLQRVGADFTVTVTVTGDVSAFALEAEFRDQVGPDGTAFATKTTGGGGIVATYTSSTAVVITLLAADMLDLPPGPYVWRLTRTDAGAGFDLVDWSTILLTPNDDSPAPQLVNMSQVIAMSRGALTETESDTDAKYYNGIIIPAAEATFRRLCGREFSYGEYVEYLDAPVRGNLYPREGPIISITEMKFDAAGGYGEKPDTFGSDTVLDTPEYFFRKDRPDGKGHAGEIFTTRSTGWSWYWGGGRLVQPAGLLGLTRQAIPGAFKVTYKAGFKLIPGDIIFAVSMLVVQMSQRTARGVPLQSESGMQYSYTLASMADEALRLDSFQNIVAGYRRGDMNVG